MADKVAVGKEHHGEPKSLDAQEDADRAHVIGVRGVVDKAERGAAEEERGYIGDQCAHDRGEHPRCTLI